MAATKLESNRNKFNLILQLFCGALFILGTEFCMYTLIRRDFEGYVLEAIRSEAGRSELVRILESLDQRLLARFKRDSDIPTTTTPPVYVRHPPPPGPPREQGSPGPVGLPGLPGPQGLSGLSGPGGGNDSPAPPGLPVKRGIPGFNDSKGAQGEQGVSGIKGDTGNPGPQRGRGPIGVEGLRGEPGLSGITEGNGRCDIRFTYRDSWSDYFIYKGASFNSTIYLVSSFYVDVNVYIKVNGTYTMRSFRIESSNDQSMKFYEIGIYSNKVGVSDEKGRKVWYDLWIYEMLGIIFHSKGNILIFFNCFGDDMKLSSRLP